MTWQTPALTHFRRSRALHRGGWRIPSHEDWRGEEKCPNFARERSSRVFWPVCEYKHINVFLPRHCVLPWVHLCETLPDNCYSYLWRRRKERVYNGCHAFYLQRSPTPAPPLAVGDCWWSSLSREHDSLRPKLPCMSSDSPAGTCTQSPLPVLPRGAGGCVAVWLGVASCFSTCGLSSPSFGGATGLPMCAHWSVPVISKRIGKIRPFL